MLQHLNMTFKYGVSEMDKCDKTSIIHDTSTNLKHTPKTCTLKMCEAGKHLPQFRSLTKTTPVSTKTWDAIKSSLSINYPQTHELEEQLPNPEAPNGHKTEHPIRIPEP